MAKDDKSEQQDSAPSDMNPLVIMARLTQALEKLTERQQTTPNDMVAGLMGKLTSALERVSESQVEGAKLIASETRRAHRPSNEVVPQISVFNRRGLMLPDNAEGPRKPQLKCIMVIPWLVEWESCTREEVELLNLLESGEYHVKRIDNSKVRVTVLMEYKVDGKTPSRLLVTHDTAFNNDNFRLMPALPDWLRQILKQHARPTAAKAAAILTDEEEEALIEAGELSISV